jgi:hypothetical protein
MGHSMMTDSNPFALLANEDKEVNDREEALAGGIRGKGRGGGSRCANDSGSGDNTGASSIVSAGNTTRTAIGSESRSGENTIASGSTIGENTCGSEEGVPESLAEKSRKRSKDGNDDSTYKKRKRNMQKKKISQRHFQKSTLCFGKVFTCLNEILGEGFVAHLRKTIFAYNKPINDASHACTLQ